jgi:hypothetical protein
LIDLLQNDSDEQVIYESLSSYYYSKNGNLSELLAVADDANVGDLLNSSLEKALIYYNE